jgi:hypothetical protein
VLDDAALPAVEALHRLEGVLDRREDLEDRDPVGRPRQAVAAGPPRALAMRPAPRRRLRTWSMKSSGMPWRAAMSLRWVRPSPAHARSIMILSA